MILALSIGTALAIAALCYVLYPLFFGAPLVARAARRRMLPRASASAREEAVAVLREIEFDRETGKLADADYHLLKTQWTERALVAMRAEDAAAASAAASAAATSLPDESSVDPAERAIRRARAVAIVCPDDGPRPEPDAAYCSDCGRWLTGTCASCGASVTGEGARFCNSCGTALAA